MVDTAFKTLYRDEYIAEFERGESSLRASVTTSAKVEAKSAVFLTSNSNREAVTRGANGLIPAATGSQTQYEVVLEEWHDLPQKTSFDIVRAQADQRRIMMEESRKVINRKVDDQIIAELATATLGLTTAAPLDFDIVLAAVTMLGNNNVPLDGNVFGLVTPAAMAYLHKLPEFASADYVQAKANVDGPRMREWMGVKWSMHTGLPGVGTNGASCFIYHKSALGHAYNKEIDARVGYDEEQDYYWTRTTIFMAAKKLLNPAIIKIAHDDSGLVLS